MPATRNAYTSLRRVRNFLSLASQDTSDDAYIEESIRHASRGIDLFTSRFFYPRRETRRYDLLDQRLLRLNEEDLLEVKGLSDHNGASEIDAAAYFTKSGDNWNEYPKDRIELDFSVGSLLNYSGTRQQAVYVDGVWSFHEDYDNAWVNSEASLTADLPSAQTWASVSGSGGQNELGYSPRFEDDQTWRLGDEFVHVTSVDNSSLVRIKRGVNGTTATSHASETTVETWDVEPEIERVATQLAAFQYMSDKSPVTGRVMQFNVGGFTVEQPETWPPGAKARLDRFVKRRVYSF